MSHSLSFIPGGWVNKQGIVLLVVFSLSAEIFIAQRKCLKCWPQNTHNLCTLRARVVEALLSMVHQFVSRLRVWIIPGWIMILSLVNFTEFSMKLTWEVPVNLCRLNKGIRPMLGRGTEHTGISRGQFACTSADSPTTVSHCYAFAYPPVSTLPSIHWDSWFPLSRRIENCPRSRL